MWLRMRGLHTVQCMLIKVRGQKSGATVEKGGTIPKWIVAVAVVVAIKLAI